MGDFEQLSRELTLLLGSAFFTIAILVTAAVIYATKAIIRSNERLATRYEELRANTLREFAELQREQNNRLVRDTRATIARMNAVADSLWSGLSTTVCEPERPADDQL